MAYNGTIPALGNLISNDIPAIQENFSLLESAQVVDEGSTADGDYIRYENGWQICTHEVTLVFENDSVLWYDTWNFPQSFTANPYPVFSFGINLPNPERYGVPVVFSISTTSLTPALHSDNKFTGTTTVTCYIIAIGRWK